MSDYVCLAIGAGAIGKSIAGKIFCREGIEFTYADVMDAVIEDINKRGGYSIYNMADGEIALRDKVVGARAVKVADAYSIFERADVMCTSVGPKGLAAFMPSFTEWVRLRGDASDKKLRVILLENDTDCLKNMKRALIDANGSIPEWLEIGKASIERITMPYTSEDGFDCKAEPFIPVIVERSCYTDTDFCGRGECFDVVDDLMRYYYRKLYTNNLGHAVMGYYGLAKGYKDTFDALGDPEILDRVKAVFSESCQVMVDDFGFSEEEISAHVDNLITTRYRCFRDDLERLSRDVKRKVGRSERIMGVIERSFKNGKVPVETIKLLTVALLSEGITDISDALVNVCGISKSEQLYQDIINNI